MSDTNVAPVPDDDPNVAAVTQVPARRSPEKIPRQFGRYRIGDCLGRGGMGVVFKAHDTQLDRQVALKIPFLESDEDGELRKRFYREARAAAALHHANICAVFDVGEFSGVPYLTMAFIDGRSLLKVLGSDPPFTPQRVALLVRKLALAMQEAHTHGVVHRDLKPANIILRPNGEPVIMDFGLARRVGDTHHEGLTRQGDVLGTIEYMSPEQVDGDNSTIGPPTDIFTLGVIMYEMMCGRRPFIGSTTSMLAAILTKEPPRPTELRPELPPKLEEICLKAMAKKPADRFATMAEFATALADFLRSGLKNPATTAARPVSPPSAQPNAATRPIARSDVDTDDVRRRQADEAERPRPSSIKVPSKKLRSGRRRKSARVSPWPWIIAAGFALVAVASLIGSAIVFWPREDKSTNQALSAVPTIPATRSVAPSPTPPTKSQTPQTPTPRPKPAAGFAIQFQPESVTLAVGEPKAVALKVERHDYQGAIRLRVTVGKEMRVAPSGPLTLDAGQADPVFTIRLLSQPTAGTAELRIAAEAVQDAQRTKATASLAVRIAPDSACLRLIDLNSKFVPESLAFTPDLSAALVGGAGPPDAKEPYAIQIYGLPGGELAGTLSGHRDRVINLAVSADGKSVFSASADRTVAIWDLAQRHRKQVSNDLNTRVFSAAMSPDARRGLVVYSNSLMRVNLDTFQAIGQPLKATQLFGVNAENAIRCASVSADHRGLAGGNDGKLVLIDFPEKGRPGSHKLLMGHSEVVLSAAFAPSGRFAASGGGAEPGSDYAVRFWDVSNQTLKWTAKGHTRPVVCLAFAPDGARLVSGSLDGTVRVWNAADGQPLATFTGHAGSVMGLAFAPDGKSLWSGAADKSLRQWRLP
jgi:serine/threonine protein kinase